MSDQSKEGCGILGGPQLRFKWVKLMLLFSQIVFLGCLSPVQGSLWFGFKWVKSMLLFSHIICLGCSSPVEGSLQDHPALHNTGGHRWPHRTDVQLAERRQQQTRPASHQVHGTHGPLPAHHRPRYQGKYSSIHYTGSYKEKKLIKLNPCNLSLKPRWDADCNYFKYGRIYVGNLDYHLWIWIHFQILFDKLSFFV